MTHRWMAAGCVAAALAGPAARAQETPGAQAAPTPADYAKALVIDPDFSERMKAQVLEAIDICRAVAASRPDDPASQRTHAEALLNDGRLAPAYDVLRPLGEAGDVQALTTIFEIYAMRERHSERSVVLRADAEAAIRKAAAAGHPPAMYRLAYFLDRGGPLKRDPAEALAWAEKAAAANSDPENAAMVALLLAETLVAPSRSPAERERGIALLETLDRERLHEHPVFLANALRGDSARRDPARARALLETALTERRRTAVAPLAEMLIAGEGGARDVARAIAMLRENDAHARSRLLLGTLHAEGKIVRRDPRLSIPLMEVMAYHEIEPRLRLVELLVVHTDVRLRNASLFVTRLTEAAAVGEPGAHSALMEAKFSRHDQLRDEAGGLALAEQVADRDDRAMLRVLERRVPVVSSDPTSRALAEGRVRGALQRLTDRNVAGAFTLHGKLLRVGALYPQDDVAATKSLQRAAEGGDVEGMFLLAKAYDDGLGTPKNPREQIRWLREAGKRGSVDARRALIWEARFDSARQLTLRDSVTEQIALYNDRLGSVSTMDFMGLFMQSRMGDFQPRRIAEAVKEGYRLAPAGLAEDRLVPLLRQIPQTVRAEVETVLKSQGHYAGDTQGYFGPDARAALGAWVDAGLGQEPKPATSPSPAAPKTAALVPAERPAGGKPTVADIPVVPEEAFKAYWDRILAAFKGAKTQKDAREAFRMLTVMARGGNTHARNQLVKTYDDNALVRELVTPSDITLYAIDVLLSKLLGMEKAQIEFVFNTGRIDRARQMPRVIDGFVEAVRDDPRLLEEGTLTGLLKDMVFVGGVCDAIAVRLRSTKLANVSDNDGCGPVARDALLDLAKREGPTGRAIQNRIAASKQILAETSSSAAKPAETAKPRR